MPHQTTIATKEHRQVTASMREWNRAVTRFEATNLAHRLRTEDLLENKGLQVRDWRETL